MDHFEDRSTPGTKGHFAPDVIFTAHSAPRLSVDNFPECWFNASTSLAFSVPAHFGPRATERSAHRANIII